MKECLSLVSEIKIFDIEETEDEIEYEKEGLSYIQLFSINYAIELIESDLDLKGKGYSNKKIANRLLEYRIYDA